MRKWPVSVCTVWTTVARNTRRTSLIVAGTPGCRIADRALYTGLHRRAARPPEWRAAFAAGAPAHTSASAMVPSGREQTVPPQYAA